MWLALAAAAWFGLSAAAAPAPRSEGPISDALAVRALLPATTAPLVTPAVMVEKGVIELQALEVETRQMKFTEIVVLPNGKQAPVERVVTQAIYQMRAARRKTEGIKFFTVTAEGKLEAIDAAKATGMLKERTPVLTGGSADVDPRALELVKPRTLYLVLPQAGGPLDTPTPPAEPMPPPPPERDKE
jgi:hypothetical protein